MFFINIKTMNPYEVLEVPRDFTLQQLRENYKKIALSVHPDKGGSEALFLLVTKCYKILHEEYKRRVGDKQFYELKAAYKKEQATSSPSSSYTPIKKTSDSSSTSGSRFNLEKFNKVFDDNRMNNVTDKGYDDWMSANDVKEQRKLRAFTHEGFNKHFEKYASNDKNNKFLVVYKEPEALVGAKKIMFTELGKDDIDDFSGDNTSKKQLNFMDYKVAHTTTKIADPSMIKKVKQYKTIGELEKDRSQVSYSMSERDMEEYLAKQQLEKIKEQNRIDHLRHRDEEIAKHYQRVNMMMLGR